MLSWLALLARSEATKDGEISGTRQGPTPDHASSRYGRVQRGHLFLTGAAGSPGGVAAGRPIHPLGIPSWGEGNHGAAHRGGSDRVAHLRGVPPDNPAGHMRRPTVNGSRLLTGHTMRTAARHRGEPQGTTGNGSDHRSHAALDQSVDRPGGMSAHVAQPRGSSAQHTRGHPPLRRPRHPAPHCCGQPTKPRWTRAGASRCIAVCRRSATADPGGGVIDPTCRRCCANSSVGPLGSIRRRHRMPRSSRRGGSSRAGRPQLSSPVMRSLTHEPAPPSAARSPVSYRHVPTPPTRCSSHSRNRPDLTGGAVDQREPVEPSLQRQHVIDGGSKHRQLSLDPPSQFAGEGGS